MSLGPPGASLNPEQAENFEDVSGVMASENPVDVRVDGKTICCQRSAASRWIYP